MWIVFEESGRIIELFNNDPGIDGAVELEYKIDVNDLEKYDLYIDTVDYSVIHYVIKEHGKDSNKEISIDDLVNENQLLKAQNKALQDKADFHEDVLAEIILTVHST